MIKVTFLLDQTIYPEATESIIRAILVEGFNMYNSFDPKTIKIEEVEPAREVAPVQDEPYLCSVCGMFTVAKEGDMCSICGSDDGGEE